VGEGTAIASAIAGAHKGLPYGETRSGDDGGAARAAGGFLRLDGGGCFSSVKRLDTLRVKDNWGIASRSAA